MASRRANRLGSASSACASFCRSTLPLAVVPGKAASMAVTAWPPSYSLCTSASASHTPMPSSRKRAAAVDLPMPIDPVSPITSIRRLPEAWGARRRLHVAMILRLPQLRQQRQQRQADDGEVVAVDALEQLDAPAFDLVAADRAANRRPGLGEVVIEIGIAEGAHGQRGDLRCGSRRSRRPRANAAAVCSWCCWPRRRCSCRRAMARLPGLSNSSLPCAST